MTQEKDLKETREIVKSTIKGLVGWSPKRGKPEFFRVKDYFFRDASNVFRRVSYGRHIDDRNEQFNRGLAAWLPDTSQPNFFGVDRSVGDSLLMSSPPLTLAGWLDMIEKAIAFGIINDASDLIKLWNDNGFDPEFKPFSPPLSAREIKAFNTRPDTTHCCKCGETLKDIGMGPTYKHCPKCEG